MTTPAKTWKAATPGPFWITEYCGSTKVLRLAPLGSSNTRPSPSPTGTTAFLPRANDAIPVERR